MAYLPVFFVTLLLFWIGGVLRFDYSWAEILFKTLFFPFGYLYLIYESHALSSLDVTHIFNDEIFQGMVFLIAVIGQSLIYYLVYSIVKTGFEHQR
jgi:hypothetical protein